MSGLGSFFEGSNENNTLGPMSSFVCQLFGLFLPADLQSEAEVTEIYHCLVQYAPACVVPCLSLFIQPVNHFMPPKSNSHLFLQVWNYDRRINFAAAFRSRVS